MPISWRFALLRLFLRLFIRAFLLGLAFLCCLTLLFCQAFLVCQVAGELYYLVLLFKWCDGHSQIALLPDWRDLLRSW